MIVSPDHQGRPRRPHPCPTASRSSRPIRGARLAAAAAVLLAATVATAPVATATAPAPGNPATPDGAVAVNSDSPDAAAAVGDRLPTIPPRVAAAITGVPATDVGGDPTADDGGSAAGTGNGAPIPSTVRDENAGARSAVVALTSTAGSGAAIPPDFAAVMGYHPTVEQGLLVNPGGDCSSPVPLPAEFENACKAHDLGYDLLRYADARGEPLTAWARQALDATLEQRMHAACTARQEPIARARCRIMASVATTAVDLNSRRQDYGPPVHENLADATAPTSPSMAAAYPLAAAALALSGFATGRGLRRRADRPDTGGFRRPTTEASARGTSA
ncbi:MULTISPECIES: hypothetical protein [unclassified Nocardia]|uniref:hypothetical protein n=1 Tax=unclassified Nocardia TaxID=2637762 RepID=UPI00278C3DA8|nr:MULTISPECIES: hypothetical protein [unclassified Nocardia]